MNGIKRASRFLKQYFSFSRTERKGIYVLLLLMAVSLAAPPLWGLVFPTEPLHIQVNTLPEEPAPAESVSQPGDAAMAASIDPFVPVVFDPNTADSTLLTTLGFSPRAARSLLNYRQKGGRFRKPEDLYRLYHVDSNVVLRLLPYVRIESKPAPFREAVGYEKATAHKPRVAIELNSADSEALVSLYGIGPKTASRILEFRARSGGFFSLGQLTDVYGMREELLPELDGKLYVDASLVKGIRINSVSYEELKQHPYLRYKTASAIINYRQQHGPFRSVEALKNIVLLPDSMYRKIAPYILLEE